MLIYLKPAERAAREAKATTWEAWKAYTVALSDAGVLVADAGLHSADTATCLRKSDGERQVQDGPYADSKEQLGGLYIIDVPDLDAALRWAKKMPAPDDGVIEIRPNLSIPA